MFEQLLQQVRPLEALCLNDGAEGVHPLTGFLAVQVWIRGACRTRAADMDVSSLFLKQFSTF